jgi:phosphoglycolate phosphatase
MSKDLAPKSVVPDLRGIAAVAFDLDGTLVDSAADIGYAVNTALTQAGLRSFDTATVRTWIGDGPDALIARALVAQGLSPDDEPLRRQLRHGFNQATLSNPMDHGTVYPGVADLLRALHGQLPLAVVTNKPTELARAVIGASGLLPFFTQVQGADTLAQRKPAPLMLQSTAAALGVATEQLLMVGDAPPDMLAARAAGCPAALVTWGYGQHAMPEALPLWRVDTPQLLWDRLQDAGRIVSPERFLSNH